MTSLDNPRVQTQTEATRADVPLNSSDNGLSANPNLSRQQLRVAKRATAKAVAKAAKPLLGTKRDSLHPPLPINEGQTGEKDDSRTSPKERKRRSQRYMQVKATERIRAWLHSSQSKYEQSLGFAIGSMGKCGAKPVPGRNGGETVAFLKQMPDGQAHYSMLACCGSPWGCGKCAPKIRDLRAEQIKYGCNRALSLGHSVIFITLTLQHRKYDDGAEVFKVISEGFKKSREGKAWTKKAKKLGYVTAIRAMEVTHSDDHGFHPHAHSLWYFDHELKDEELLLLRKYMREFWQAWGAKHGRKVHGQHGVDVRRITNEGEIGEYLTKIQKFEGPEDDEREWHIDMEMARGDLKKGQGKSTTIFQHLDAFLETGDLAEALMYAKFVKVTKGKKFIYLSKQFKTLYLEGMDVVDEDKELAETEVKDSKTVLAMNDSLHRAIGIKDRGFRERSLRADVLTAVERRGVRGVMLLLDELDIGFTVDDITVATGEALLTVPVLRLAEAVPL